VNLPKLIKGKGEKTAGTRQKLQAKIYFPCQSPIQNLENTALQVENKNNKERERKMVRRGDYIETGGGSGLGRSRGIFY